MKKRMAEAQRRNELRIDSIKLEQMEQQYKTMMDTLEQTSVVRHDLAHHFLVIAEYCRRGEYGENSSLFRNAELSKRHR